MKKQDILKDMFILQQKLNDETNGIGWENGYTKNDKLINWKRCIYMECAELIDSFAWKHWKDIDKATDWDNVTVEIVDIWHFIVSYMLEHYKNNNLGDMDKIVEDIMESKSFKTFCKDVPVLNNKDNLGIVNDIEKIIHITSGFDMNLYDGLLNYYFDLCLNCGVNLEKIYRFYIAKNILNKFRQDHGYKEGTYKKVWNGQEDNEVMTNLLQSKIQNSSEIYSELEKIYKGVK